MLFRSASLRYQVLDAARRFKSSWIELGRYLYAVQKDKLYRDWGFTSFEAYAQKEIGVRQATAVKLVRSYFFLEKEEPGYLKERLNADEPARIPSCESVNALRLAKGNARIPEKEYEGLREDVLENAREDAHVKEKIRYILKGHPPRLTPGQREEKKERSLQALIKTARRLKAEIAQIGLPKAVSRKAEELIDALEELQP